MHTNHHGVRTRLSEHDLLPNLSRHFDHEVYALELQEDPKLGAAIRCSVIQGLKARQQSFDQALAKHPATVADRERRSRRLREGIKRLAHRWHATLELSA